MGCAPVLLFRASRAVMTMPEASQLAWLEKRDIAERATWVSQFREGDEPLGQVVQSVMEKRGAHWDTPIQNMVVRPNPAFQLQQPQGQQQARTRASQPRPFSPSSPMKTKPGVTADTLRDGKTLSSAALKGHRATKACISVPKSFGVVGLVG